MTKDNYPEGHSMSFQNILPTGQTSCYSETGDNRECRGSGEDAEFFSDSVWSENRFELINENLVRDLVTDLIWTRNCCISEFPVQWEEGLAFIEQMRKENFYGRNDWRMPNRRELRSLIDHGTKKPALTRGHPFKNIFLGWFWTSTTAAIATRYAWYVHLEGGRMFYGNKDGYSWLWPVCGTTEKLAFTGARQCYDGKGEEIPCSQNRQDASLARGVSWPDPRFTPEGHGVLDNLTGLVWYNPGIYKNKATSWQEALTSVRDLAEKTQLPWRVPTINELESLVDASAYSPALPKGHPFASPQEAYWSSTTSFFETDWAYVLYLNKGAVGVGYKKNRDFALWPVMSTCSEACSRQAKMKK
jgi:hypothetical protein